ncbi:MAG TPA: glycosyltransferase, partial [Acidimicrobiales bacterium]|nr:glycosyltransferase [Acidimicrobiales bacterium]
RRDDVYFARRRPGRTTTPVRHRVDRVRLMGRLARASRHLEGDLGPFDLVHGHFSAAGPLISAMARAIRVPYVVTEHSSSFSGMNPANPSSRRGLARARRVGDEAAVVIPVSSELQRAMELRGVRAKFETVPNPVDTTIFRPPCDLPASTTTEIVSVGRLVPIKGHDLLLDAFARLRRRRPGLRLTIVGHGPEETALQSQAGRLGIEDLVTFTGALPAAAVADRLARSHVFALASRWENLSVAVLEACVVGLPAVVTRVGGLPEIEAESLHLVPPDDVDELVRSLDDVLGALPDLATRQRWSTAAHDQFGLEAVGERLTQIYDEVRSRRVAPRGSTRR